MKKLSFWVPLLALPLFQQCAKNELPLTDGETTPVFNVAGSFGSTPYAFTAGNSDTYMFTSIEETATSIKSIGRLAGVDCRDSCSSIMFTIHQQKPVEALIAANWPFISTNISSDVILPITCAPVIPDSNFGAHLLTLQGYTQSSNTLPLKVNLSSTAPVSITQYALHEPSGIKFSTSTDYLPLYPDSCKAVQIKAEIAQGQISLTAITTQSNPVFTWTTGGDTDQITLNDLPGNTIAVLVSSPDYGCNSKAIISNVSNDVAVSFVSPVFEVSAQEAYATDLQEGVELQYIGQDGVIYTSKPAYQPAGTYFTIKSIIPYKPNENGLPTVLLEVAYRCQVSSTDTTGLIPVKVLEGSGTIAVGRPH